MTVGDPALGTSNYIFAIYDHTFDFRPGQSDYEVT
jgi:hypothetical protein